MTAYVLLKRRSLVRMRIGVTHFHNHHIANSKPIPHCFYQPLVFSWDYIITLKALILTWQQAPSFRLDFLQWWGPWEVWWAILLKEKLRMRHHASCFGCWPVLHPRWVKVVSGVVRMCLAGTCRMKLTLEGWETGWWGGWTETLSLCTTIFSL